MAKRLNFYEPYSEFLCSFSRSKDIILLIFEPEKSKKWSFWRTKFSHMIIVLQVMGKQSLDSHSMILDLTTIQEYYFLVKIILLEHTLSLKRCYLGEHLASPWDVSLRISTFHMEILTFLGIVCHVAWNAKLFTWYLELNWSCKTIIVL